MSISMKFYIIDGYNFAFRAFYAFPKLQNKNNFEIGGLIGFVKMLINFLEKMQPDYFLMIFDVGKSFRRDLYDQYKRNRPPISPELAVQLPLLRNVCNQLGIIFDELDGYEADDLIASYAKNQSLYNIDIIAVSTDKDLMQIVDDRISMLNTMKWALIKEKDVIEKFGVLPKYVVEVQGLCGDASDNIPGVPGIGIKTASKIIQQHQTLEVLFENLESNSIISNTISSKLKNSLVENKDNAFLSRQLALLSVDAPQKFSLKELSYQNLEFNLLQKCIEYLHNLN